MKRLLASICFAVTAWAGIAAAQITLPFPGSASVSVIGTPVSLGCSQTTGAISTLTLTTTAAIPAGALVIAGAHAGFAAVQTVTGVSDGTNTYSNAVTAAWEATGSDVVAMWHVANAAAVSSGASLTFTFSGTTVGATNAHTICAAYVAGITASPLDKSANAKQLPGTAFSSGTTGTLTQANEIAFGFMASYQNCTSVTEGSGFTTISPSPKLQGGGNNWCGNLAFKTVAATTALNYQPTATSSFGGSVIATFKGF